MTLILEKELSDILESIYSKWERGGINLPETYKLYFSAKEKYLSFDEEARTQKASELILKIVFAAGKISEDFVKEWQNGKLKPRDKELELLKKGCDEVLVAFDNHFKKELLAYQKKPYDIHHSEVKEKIRRIRKLIDAELATI